MIRFSKITHNVRELFPKLTEYFSTRQDVEFAYLFGSYGIGYETPMSDVDIAVYLMSEVPKDKYFDIRLRIIQDATEILHTDEVDLSILNEADQLFAFNIISTSTILYDRNPVLRIDYEVRIIDRYLDFDPYRQIQDNAYLNNLILRSE